ncbi:VOC family protein [Ramlibacter sp.]|uniref:VOC family protein n=1 Tax=Ramlibacter sp. TaxID=1917967 RepID=UPI002FC7DBEC
MSSGGARIDHLVVVADTLEQGAAWCERTLGVASGPGGEHALMGTHNRLLRIATVDFPQAYFELIARNPGAPVPARTRWFDMDQPAQQATVRAQGPRLAHWVARVPDLDAALAAWRRQGIERGEAVEASRETPRGLLRWRISVRPDGRRLFDGCLPTLIEWEGTHPAAGMPECGVTLHALALQHPQAGLLGQALAAIGMDNVGLDQGPANLCATLRTPRGVIRLESSGL